MISEFLFATLHLVNLYATYRLARYMWTDYRQYKLDGIAELIGDSLTFFEKVHNKFIDLFMLVVTAAALVNLCFTILHIYLLLQGFLI